MADLRVLLLVLAADVPGEAAAGEGGGPLPAVEVVEGHPVRTVLAPDTIAAIDFPPAVSAADASFLDDEDLVIGVVAGGRARAYPLAELDWHEVVNDELGGTAIAVTW